MLKSERHDAFFYDRMWKSIREDYRWQGEIWNKRKNGLVYPELLTISAVIGDVLDVTNLYSKLFRHCGGQGSSSLNSSLGVCRKTALLRRLPPHRETPSMARFFSSILTNLKFLTTRMVMTLEIFYWLRYRNA
jgi:hypothetical protein